MTALDPNATPGLAGSDSDTYTQSDAVWHKAPKNDRPGFTFNDLAQYTLVGRVTETGELLKSVATAADGSQVPVGILTSAVTVDDSNSLVDSNSGPGAEYNVRYYTDGEWNFDRLQADGAIDASWTFDTLNRAVDASGCNLHFDRPRTATPTEQS